jgi:hypothetical protein
VPQAPFFFALIEVAFMGPVPAAGASRARDDPNRQDIVQHRLEQLDRLVRDQEARIQVLRHRFESDNAASREDLKEEEIKHLVRELMADSEFRQSLYPEVQQVGYEDGFYLKSSDEAFLLKINGMMQVRWTGADRQRDNPRVQGRNVQDDLNSFGLQYVELDFAGYIHDPRLRYSISTISASYQANGVQTYYANISYQFADEFVLGAGIFDLPQGFSELVDDAKMLFVDRPLAEEAYNVGYTAGLKAWGVLFKRLEYAAGIFNGIGNVYDSPSQDQLDTNFACAASLVCRLLGNGVGDDETDLAFSRDPKWDLGASFAYNDDNGDRTGSSIYSIPERVRSGRGIGGYAQADLTGTDMLQFGAYTAFRWRGLAVTAEWYLRTIESDNRYSPWELGTGGSGARHFQGGYVEAGYFIVPGKIEVAARLGGVWNAGGDSTWEYTFGANYYPYQSHKFKVQADFTHIDEAPLSSDHGGWIQNDHINMFRVALLVAF